MLTRITPNPLIAIRIHVGQGVSHAFDHPLSRTRCRIQASRRPPGGTLCGIEGALCDSAEPKWTEGLDEWGKPPLPTGKKISGTPRLHRPRIECVYAHRMVDFPGLRPGQPGFMRI